MKVLYSNNPRRDLLETLANDMADFENVLDLGCCDGSTLNYISKKFSNVSVFGCDLAPDPNALISGIMELDLNKKEELKFLIPRLKKKQLILILDVLEHLTKPELVLGFLSTEIKSDAKILVSLPNVRNWRVWFNLLKNDWPSEELGIFDQTHLHFFTTKSAERLLSQYFFVEKVSFRYSENPYLRVVQSLMPSVLCGQFSLYLSKRRG